MPSPDGSLSDTLYVVEFSVDGQDWGVVRDEGGDDGEQVTLSPAAFLFVLEAERRRRAMAEMFPDHHYRVVEFVHHNRASRTPPSCGPEPVDATPDEAQQRAGEGEG